MMSPSPAPSDASHESDHGTVGANAATKAQSATAKDKACPYCGQKFTSSSLGRHLDQYISKKKPDGLHNVEEIKRLRAGITRRSARGKKNEEQGNVVDSSGLTTPNRASSTPTPTARKALWQTAGTVQDALVGGVSAHTSNSALPPVSSFPVPSAQAGTKRDFSAYAADIFPISSAETARALELSLREVLDAINAATNKAEPAPEPFEFDIYTQTFPALCIALLPPPPTLWQTVPFQTTTSTPITAPGHEQLAALRNVISDLLDNWKWDALAHVQRTTQNAINVGHEADRLSVETEDLKSKARSHLDTAFNVFASQHSDQQQHQWTVELLRAYDREKDKNKSHEARVEDLLQEITRLRQQIEYLERCQWPREMALWPPDRMAISNVVQRELKTSLPTGLTGAQMPALDSQRHRWDYDSLINKWKRRVQEDRVRRSQPSLMDQPEQSDTAMSPAMTSRNHSMNDAEINTSRVESPVCSNGNTRESTHNAARAQSLGLQDKPTRPPSHSAPRTRTPAQGSVQIVSDIEDTFARFAPYLKRKDMQERSGV